MNGEQTRRLVSAMLRPFAAKLGAMIAPGVVKAVDDSKALQTLKVKWLGGVAEPVTHLQPGGITHVPFDAANGDNSGEGVLLRTPQGVTFFLGGTARKTRPKGSAKGDTVVWASGDPTDQADIYIHLQASGDILIRTKLGTGKVTAEGDLDVTGEVKANSSGGGFVTLTGLKIPSPFGPLGPPIPGN